jgi:hypothetical protein
VRSRAERVRAVVERVWDCEAARRRVCDAMVGGMRLHSESLDGHERELRDE